MPSDLDQASVTLVPMYNYSTNILLHTAPQMPAQTKQARPTLLHCTIIYSADIDLLSAFMSRPDLGPNTLHSI